MLTHTKGLRNKKRFSVYYYYVFITTRGRIRTFTMGDRRGAKYLGRVAKYRRVEVKIGVFACYYYLYLICLMLNFFLSRTDQRKG